jgi:predicted dinucleotide-binding enzyme
MKNKAKIGIIGAGRLGTAVARQSLKAGYEVAITNAHGPESLRLTLSVLLPGAVAMDVPDLIAASDIVILAIPLNQYSTLAPDSLAGKIVIDAMNYWPPTEGDIPEFMIEGVTTSEYLQQYFKGSRLVKTLNHVAYNELEEHSLPPNTPGRRAIALAGDDEDAKKEVEVFINDLGFDPVDLGSLSQGKKFQPDTPLFNARYTADDLR